MNTFIKGLEDSLLTYLQKRCAHPDIMVAADILEGGAEGLAVKYCRRCGAVKPTYEASRGRPELAITYATSMAGLMSMTPTQDSPPGQWDEEMKGDPTAIGDCIADEVRRWYEANRETWWQRRKRRYPNGLADEFMLGLIQEVHRVERVYSPSPERKAG